MLLGREGVLDLLHTGAAQLHQAGVGRGQTAHSSQPQGRTQHTDQITPDRTATPPAPAQSCSLHHHGHPRRTRPHGFPAAPDYP